jgi:plastocyanin
MGKSGRRALALATGAIAAGAAATGVAFATTGPAPHVLVNVTISDTAIRLSKKQVSDVTFVDFYLHNTGKLSHNMLIGRTESVAVKPGERVHFYVGFPVFGWYPYRVKLHGTPHMRGRFHINSPQPPD